MHEILKTCFQHVYLPTHFTTQRQFTTQGTLLSKELHSAHLTIYKAPFPLAFPFLLHAAYRRLRCISNPPSLVYFFMYKYIVDKGTRKRNSEPLFLHANFQLLRHFRHQVVHRSTLIRVKATAAGLVSRGPWTSVNASCLLNEKSLK